MKIVSSQPLEECGKTDYRNRSASLLAPYIVDKKLLTIPEDESWVLNLKYLICKNCTFRIQKTK